MCFITSLGDYWPVFPQPTPWFAIVDQNICMECRWSYSDGRNWNITKVRETEVPETEKNKGKGKESNCVGDYWNQSQKHLLLIVTVWKQFSLFGWWFYSCVSQGGTLNKEHKCNWLLEVELLLLFTLLARLLCLTDGHITRSLGLFWQHVFLEILATTLQWL